MSTTETKVRHTAGPWGLSDSGYLTNEGGKPVMSSADVADEGRKRICVVDIHAKAKRGHGWETTCAERDANALLIAAAPDMLEALEAATELIDIMLTGTDVDIFRQRDAAKAWQKSVRTIVAKAKGGAA